MRCSARAATTAAVFLGLSAVEATAQSTTKPDNIDLPPIVVEQVEPKPTLPVAKPAQSKQAISAAPQVSEPTDVGLSELPPALAVGERSGSLTVPNTAEATAEIQRTPGAVEVVSDKAYKASTPSATIKDALDYVPGVFVQPKWGDDTRLSIRGSGLSRNFHLRGVQLYMDGIPINTADGYGDFQEIDPTAYRYIEVFKGSNALRFGANSLGGAINFVMPTGYDADRFGARVDVGSFGFRKFATSSGGVYGAADYFITGTWQEQDGYREHSDGESVRGSANVGYRLSSNIETRFYLNANDVEQRIPGSVTRTAALTDPKAAAVNNILQDYQRNIETVRLANKTSVRLDDNTTVEFGAFFVDRKLDHPIYQWLDYAYQDAGGFVRAVDAREVGGHANRFIFGVNIHGGELDNKQFENIGGQKGALLSSSLDESFNVSTYVENTFYALPDVGLVTGLQYLHAKRERRDRFFSDPPSWGVPDANPDDSGTRTYDLLSPKVGILWDVDPGWQFFANVSRSAEAPSFGENSFTSAAASNIEAQRATTFEIGTRGKREDYRWDIAVYRMNIDNEFQCLETGNTGSCTQVNLDKTIHQGVELGGGAALLKNAFVHRDRLWLNAAYTFNDFRFDDDPVFDDNELPGAPRHFVRAELLYQHPSGFYLGPNVEWVPEAYYADSANSLETKAYALLGAKIGFDDGGPISAYIEGRNLTDETYIASTSIATRADASSALFEPGNGRAIYAGVQVKW